MKITMMTITQTVDVKFKKSQLEFQDILERPTAPLWLQEMIVAKNEPEGLGFKDHWTVWHPDGNIHLQYTNGNKVFFDPPPTLQDAVKERNGDGDLYQFHADGSVTCRVNGITYYYSAPHDATNVEEGNLLPKRWNEEQKAWEFFFGKSSLKRS